jgi:uncharacterized membrane protein YhhN
MKYKLQIQLPVFFWLLVAVDIAGIATGVSTVHFVAKPLLMPVLVLLLAVSKTIIPAKQLLLAGLFFSWLGDMFLLFDQHNSLFFIFGLICFLATHIFYIIYFLRAGAFKLLQAIKSPWLALIVLGYGALLVWFLYPHLKDLKIPVMVYAAVICTMLLCSLYLFPKLKQPANILYVSGAALFILSDSLLAVNKFYQAFYLAPVLIMLTYCAAQYFIVTGFIKQLPYDQK